MSRVVSLVRGTVLDTRVPNGKRFKRFRIGGDTIQDGVTYLELIPADKHGYPKPGGRIQLVAERWLSAEVYAQSATIVSHPHFHPN